MALKLKKTLKNRLKGAARVAVLGIGSELRGDDIAGILVAKELKKYCKIFIGATAPENFTGQIKKFKPTHLIIVDSADMAESPGAIKIIEAGKIKGISFCTHSLPINVMTDYLLKFISCEIIIIGIQPKILTFGAECSAAVKKAVKQVSLAIREAIDGD